MNVLRPQATGCGDNLVFGGGYGLLSRFTVDSPFPLEIRARLALPSLRCDLLSHRIRADLEPDSGRWCGKENHICYTSISFAVEPAHGTRNLVYDRSKIGLIRRFGGIAIGYDDCEQSFLGNLNVIGNLALV